MNIIDVHTHIGRLHDSQYEKMTHEEIREALLREMKKSGVAASIVLPSYPRVGISVHTPLERILSLTDGIPGLYPLGSIDILSHTQKDVVRIEDLLKAKRIFGVKLYPGYQHFYPSDKRCIPIYKICSRYRVPVVFHSGDTLGTSEERPHVKYAHPIHIDEVAVDFPDLTIVMAHLGNPWLVDAAEVIYKNKNVYADISGLVVGTSLKSPYGVLMKKRIEELVAYAGGDKLLYGSDWPLASMKEYIQFAKSLKISTKDRERMFAKNAMHIFKIPGL